MSLVERLADKWFLEAPHKRDGPKEVRWWLNAIADELDGPMRPMEHWAGWDSAIATLRAEK